MSEAENTVSLLTELARRVEPLHPDLMPYYEKVGPLGAPSVRHPLVFEVLLTSNAYANFMYEEKRRRLEEALTEQHWHTAVFLHERPHRADALAMIADLMPPEAYWPLVGQVWADTENAWQCKQTWHRLLTDSRPGRELMMDEDERAALQALPQKVTVYRGAVKGRNEAGLSWTLDQDKAVWFARRLADRTDPCVLLTGRVRQPRIIACLHGRGEQEVLVATSRHITVTERALL